MLAPAILLPAVPPTDPPKPTSTPPHASAPTPWGATAHRGGDGPIDFVILTAIEVERRAVCAAFGLGDDHRVKKGARVYWRGRLPLKGGEHYELVVAQSPDMANVDAALVTSDMLHHWSPGAALMVGIAASAKPGEVKLGDVVVGSDVYYYERGKETPQGRRPEPKMVPADATLWSNVTALPEWKPDLPTPRPDDTSNRPTMHFGVIASGEKVLADEAARDQIAAGHRKVLAIEMEGYGFSRAVWQSFDRVRHLVIRGVCDDGSAAKDDRWHGYAAATAAAYAKHLLLDRPLEPKGERGRIRSTVEAVPEYENAEVRALAEQLERARIRKHALVYTGTSTDAVDLEILDLRRRLREGGQLRAGDTLDNGRYLLLKQIGRGGFASVWEASDRESSRRVAVKVLHPDQARDPSRRERFFRGARVMATLEHPAVVRVLNTDGTDGGYHFFVMELVEGENLHHAVVSGRLPKEEVALLILRVAEALAEAHARGIVHRDVKPANILLDSVRSPRLTDFDLVAAKDTTGGTRTGAMGTFLFAAPEQIRKAKDVDARADVYGLGMTAMFCFYGDELPETAIRRPEDVIAGLSCDDATQRVLTQAIEVKAANRFADAQAFCNALRESLGMPATLRFLNKVQVRRCARCRFELFPDNRFCTECGAGVDAS